MNTSENKYAIITPAHNEAAFLPRVIDSISRQTTRPSKWIILDDRSTDETWSIISKAAWEHTFIEPVRKTGEADRRVGANVVHLFNLGWQKLPAGIPFVVKLDADILLPENYFEMLLSRFCEDPKLGIASGKTYNYQKGKLILERIADSHVTGGCKTYRTRCLEDIGGLIPMHGWDILDVVQARWKGWRAESFRDLRLFHLRITGYGHGMVKAQIVYGGSYYAMRAHPLFVLGKSIYRAWERPYLFGLLIFIGYLMAALRREERLANPELARFMRKEQLNRLFGRTWSQEELIPRRFKE